MQKNVIIITLVALAGVAALFIAASDGMFELQRGPEAVLPPHVSGNESDAATDDKNDKTNGGVPSPPDASASIGERASLPAPHKPYVAPTLDAEYSTLVKTMKDCMGRGVDRGKCMDAYVKEFLKAFSVKDALALIQRGMNSDRTILVQCHDIAHSVGRESFTKYEKVDDAFEACDQTCHSGCYHGVMERVFVSEGTSADHVSEQDLRAKIPTICTAHEGKPIRFKFQCLHGVGHAIMFLLDNDLPKSMAVCDLMPTYYDQSSCWGGVLMENVTSFEKSTRWIRYGDPHYPCNSLDEKYRTSCYTMQTSIMFENGLSPEKIVEECRNADAARMTCVQSLGRDISSNTRNNFPYGISVCNPLPEDERHACIQGILYAFMDLTWDGQYAFGLCDALPREEDKPFCYERSAQYLRGSLGIEKSAVEEYCATQSKNTELCQEYVQ